MKSCFRKLLPMVFLALLSFAPLSAHAATPTGPRDGMFDCLGDLDWGCRIISFLFESTDNSAYYWKNNDKVEDKPNSVLGALRVMMGFFSNALLIVASIKLLYELIQMTAETAHTGQIGGKDTNKLWAPIRLVIAIGLLVPLDTGLNSGQYIVMQIAKWGSGLASQGWLAFVSNLSENQRLATPEPPRIRELATTAFKIYACQYIMNYFASETGKGADMVGDPANSYRPFTDTTNNVLTYRYGNSIRNDICGTIKYKEPIYVSNRDALPSDAQISLALAKSNSDMFRQIAEPELIVEANKQAEMFLPTKKNASLKSTQGLENVIYDYQSIIKTNVSNPNIGIKAMSGILDGVRNASLTQGWTSAGVWFLTIARSQGQIVTGALSIPEASGPNTSELSKYEDAAEAYENFVGWLTTAPRPQDAAQVNGPIAKDPDLSVVDEVNTNSGFVSKMIRNSEAAADDFFTFLDRSAAFVGLWTDDPAKAFGDLGSSQNPFAEIANLGHKKIRLGLNFIGAAILATLGGGVADIAGSVIPSKSLLSRLAGAATAFLGKSMAAIAALLIMIAVLFLIAGVLLAYIVPLFPFTRFFFAILQWLGSLIEAMILVPFMALGHLTPKGEGFSGPNTKNAYFMIFQVFLRPILCTFGLICSMLLFYAAAKFLNASFYEATAGIAPFDAGAMRFMQKLVYSIVYVGMIYVAANTSFKMIEHIPKHALKWMGGSAQEENYDDHSNLMQIAALTTGQQILSNFKDLPGTMTKPLLEGPAAGFKDYKDRAKIASDKKDTAAANKTAEDRHNEMVRAMGSRSDSMGKAGAGRMAASSSSGGSHTGTSAETPPEGSGLSKGEQLNLLAQGYKPDSEGNLQPWYTGTPSENAIHDAQGEVQKYQGEVLGSQGVVENLERQIAAADKPHQKKILELKLMGARDSLAKNQRLLSEEQAKLESLKNRRS